MPRINVWIPDELHATIKRELPGMNVSAVVQGALAAKLDCRHDELVCAGCATPVDHRALADDAMGQLYADALGDLDPLMRRGGTVEGAIRVLRDVALRHRVTRARQMTLPRPTRANRAARAAAKVTDLPREADSRRRHPTARRRATA